MYKNIKYSIGSVYNIKGRAASKVDHRKVVFLLFRQKAEQKKTWCNSSFPLRANLSRISTILHNSKRCCTTSAQSWDSTASSASAISSCLIESWFPSKHVRQMLAGKPCDSHWYVEFQPVLLEIFRIRRYFRKIFELSLYSYGFLINILHNYDNLIFTLLAL